jgi:hypothetical protein
LNKDNKNGRSLEEYAFDQEVEIIDESNFTDVVGQDSLTRFDKPKHRKKRRKGNSKRRRNYKSNSGNPQNKNKQTL